MHRIALPPRPDLDDIAQTAGFRLLEMNGEPYWDEATAYRFTLDQVETDLEDPATELHAMCREAVSRIVEDARLMARFAIPEAHWDLVRASWRAGEQEFYGRLDLAYDGTGPAKMLEYNADTPTSLYETAAFQWDWLVNRKEAGVLPADADQLNLVYERMVERLRAIMAPGTDLHCASLGGMEKNFEDYATVETIGYAAREAGLGAHYTPLEDIGLTRDGQFADSESRVIGALFKLYPWEDMLRDPFAENLATAQCRFLEPAWKALVSNKAILPVLWEMFEGHPNLLASFFDDDVEARTDAVGRAVDAGHFADGQVSKPVFSREGASVRITRSDGEIIEAASNRDYDAHARIVQAYRPLPVFDGMRPVLGLWVVGEATCGMGIREDASRITQDLSRFKPHVIVS